MSFEEFMRFIDTALINEVGLFSEDLPDFAYYDYWKSGASPFETAADAIEYAKEA
jgi:hypothetical protein